MAEKDGTDSSKVSKVAPWCSLNKNLMNEEEIEAYNDAIRAEIGAENP